MHKFVLACAATWVFGLAAPADAQRSGRRVTTLQLLATHPFFLHGEEVIVRADTVGEEVLTYLVDDEFRLLVLDIVPPPAGMVQRLEVIGTFFDLGRLDPGDPRANGLPIERLSNSLLRKGWPGVGELPVIVATSGRPVDESSVTTLRTIALTPERYRDQSVTVIGRFGGRNLHGDLPNSPGVSRHDFVLASADAAVWIVGREPKGDGFELDLQARLDTGRWLEVTGSVRVHQGMAIIDAGTIRLAEPAEKADRPVRQERRQVGPPPEVIFSTPFDGDTDIPTDTRVRVQFSRDMAEESFEGQVQIEYGNTVTDGAPPFVEFAIEYHGRNRVLELSLVKPLEPYTEYRVDLLNGVTASDGIALAPWSLSFFSGP